MTTALEIITGAARLLGVVRKGESLDGDEATDGLAALQQMMESWANEGLLTPAAIRESFTLTAGINQYILGAGASSYTNSSQVGFDTVTPEKIVSATISSGGVDYPLTLITDEQYESIALKSTQASPGWFINYTKGEGLDWTNSDGDYYGKIRIYPTPSSADTLNLTSLKEPFNYTLLSSTRFVPPGWLRALRYNLALEMAPEFAIEPSAAVVDIARKSLAAIKLGVARNRTIRNNGGIRKDNIFTGGPL